MNKVENSFTLLGLLDGTTIYGFLCVDGSPLVQRYDSITGKYYPDFEADGFDKHPVIIPILRDTATGAVRVPTQLVWKYNGETLVFGTGGKSSNEGLVGTFEKVDSYSLVISGTSYSLPALKVAKNLVSVDNRDNDRISVSGKIEVSGQTFEFQEISKDVLIREHDASAYDVLINDDSGGMLITDGQTITMTAKVYKDGIEVTADNITFQWVKETSDGDVLWGTSKTQAVKQDDVNGLLDVRCDVKIGDDGKASGYHQIKDGTDEYHVEFTMTGITGNALRRGETVKVTPKAVTLSGTEKTGLTWSWHLRSNDGTSFTGINGASSFEAASVDITYDNVMAAGGGLKGYVSATW